MELSAVDRMTSLGENVECHYCSKVVILERFREHIDAIHPDGKYVRTEPSGPPVLKRIRARVPSQDLTEAQKRMMEALQRIYTEKARESLQKAVTFGEY